MHKRLPLLAAALLLGASATASAADGFTGWHVGGHLGHSTGSSDFDMALGGQWSIESQALRDHVVANGSDDMGPSGAAYGLQFGYDHQFGNGIVLGAEVDYSALDIKDDRASGVTLFGLQRSETHARQHRIGAETILGERREFLFGVCRFSFFGERHAA